MLKIFAFGALIGVAIAYFLLPVLQVAVGYPALLACAGVFVQKRSIAELQSSDFAYRPELQFVSFVVDASAQSVTANLLGGYVSSQVAKCAPTSFRAQFRAVVTNGLRFHSSTGCSLIELPLQQGPDKFSAQPAVCVRAISARVQTALEEHAGRNPRAKTLAVSVMRASTLEVCT